MQIIGDVKIKKNITDVDYANVVETIVSFIIRKDEDGEIKYTPYYKEYGKIVAISKHLLDGVMYENDDDILDEYFANTVINIPVDEFIKKDRRMNAIMEYVSDVVDFRKQTYIFDFYAIINRLEKSITQEQMLNDLNLKLAKKQNTLLSQQIKANSYNEKVLEYMTPEETAELNKKMLSGELNMNQIMDMAMEKYIQSDIHKQKEKELIDSQAEKIKDLQAYKNLHDARNVLSDGK